MIYISGLPDAPIGPLEVTEIACKLYWSSQEFDAGSKVTHYLVERRDIRHNEWIVIANLCKSTNFAVKGLTEGQEYLFRILAAKPMELDLHWMESFPSGPSLLIILHMPWQAIHHCYWW